MQKALILLTVLVLASATSLPCVVRSGQCPSPYLYYTFDSSSRISGNLVADVSGNLLGGVLNSVQSLTEGVLGSSLKLSAGANIITSVGTTLSSSFTFATWLNIDTVVNGDIQLATTKSSNLDINGWTCSYNSILDSITFRGRSSMVSFASIGVKAQTWNHIGLVVDGLTVRLYVNGIFFASRVQTRVCLASSLSLRIGAQISAGVSVGVDELTLFSTALTANQLFAWYNWIRQCPPTSSTPSTFAVTPNVPASTVPTCSSTKCGSGEQCCLDSNSGAQCFVPSQYDCTRDNSGSQVLCPKGQLSCSKACYSPSEYTCVSGDLKYIGGGPNCATTNCANYSCCDGSNTGPQCYNPSIYTCFASTAKTVLCPATESVCGNACYKTSLYTCQNETLIYIGPPPATGAADTTCQSSVRVPWIYFSFDRTVDTICRDDSGHGRDASWSTAPQIISGVLRSALSLNGSISSTLVGPTISLQGALSVALWLQPTNVRVGAQVIASTKLSTSDAAGWHLEHDISAKSVTFIGAGSQAAVFAGVSIEVGAWTHLAVTVDAQIATLYLNGTLHSSSAIASISASLHSVVVGVDVVGIFDELSVFDGALTLCEVKAHFASPTVVPSVQTSSWWTTSSSTWVWGSFWDTTFTTDVSISRRAAWWHWI